MGEQYEYKNWLLCHYFHILEKMVETCWADQNVVFAARG